MKISKKVVKIIIIVSLLLLFGLVLSNNSFAWKMDLSSYESATGGNSGKTVTNIMGVVINLVSTIGAGIAIIMLVVLGIQYVSAGSAGKAEAKKDLPGYIVGAVILFGVSGILKLLQMFIDANLNNI